MYTYISNRIYSLGMAWKMDVRVCGRNTKTFSLHPYGYGDTIYNHRLHESRLRNENKNKNIVVLFIVFISSFFLSIVHYLGIVHASNLNVLQTNNVHIDVIVRAFFHLYLSCSYMCDPRKTILPSQRFEQTKSVLI